jgi:hypothetical protein
VNANAAVEHGRENALVSKWLTDALMESPEVRGRKWGFAVAAAAVNLVVFTGGEGYRCIPKPGRKTRANDSPSIPTHCINSRLGTGHLTPQFSHSPPHFSLDPRIFGRAFQVEVLAVRIIDL